MDISTRWYRNPAVSSLQRVALGELAAWASLAAIPHDDDPHRRRLLEELAEGHLSRLKAIVGHLLEKESDRAAAPLLEYLHHLEALTALYSINEPEEGSDLYAMAADVDHNVSLIHELRGDREETSQIERRTADAG